MKRFLRNTLFALVVCCGLSSQAQPAIAPNTVDVFMGVDFNYRDISFRKLYELLIRLTPGVKWNMGQGWQLAGQMYIPVYNDYGPAYGHLKLSVAALSKEFDFNGKFFLKTSGGLFSDNRYGLDVKGMYIVKNWLAFEGQLGYTGHGYLGQNMSWGAPDRLTGHLGADFYIPKYDTQFRLRGGRFLYADYGVIFNVMRHFKRITVGAYAQYSNIAGKGAGFQIIALLPPYKRTKRKVNFRPASNFILNYSYFADSGANASYITDPEENDREGWFDTSKIDWGVNSTHTDFIYKDKQNKNELEKEVVK